MLKISELCKKNRLDTGLSQHAFAVQRGVSHTYIKKIEDGEYDNNPTALTVANIFRVQHFDISVLNSFEGVNHSEDFKNEVLRHFDKAYKGTAQITNSLNILKLFQEDFLKKNGFYDYNVLNKKELNKKYQKEKISGFLMPDITCYIDNRNSLNGIKNVYVFLVDHLSTIKSFVDEQKINEIVFDSVKTLVFNDEFPEDNNIIYYLTSSEKIYRYIHDTFGGLIHNLSRGKNEFYVALCRPKRETKNPERIY